MKGLQDKKGKFVKNIPLEKECLACKKMFNPRHEVQKYCNHACRASLLKKDRSRECVVCEKTFWAKTMTTRFCSQECYTKSGIRAPRGEANPRWNPNTIANLKRVVKLRDDYICQKCGLRDVEIMEVDHKQCRALYPQLANEVDNLECLCPNCHRRKTTRDAKLIAQYRRDIKSRDVIEPHHVSI